MNKLIQLGKEILSPVHEICDVVKEHRRCKSRERIVKTGGGILLAGLAILAGVALQGNNVTAGGTIGRDGVGFSVSIKESGTSGGDHEVPFCMGAL